MTDLLSLRCLPLTLLLIPILASGCASSEHASSSPKADRVQSEVASSDATRAVETVALAQRLAEYGRTMQHPELLVAAARILIETGTIPFNAMKEVEGTASDSDKPSAGEVGSFSIDALLDEARSLAAGDQVVIALIERVQAEAPELGTRGRLFGPATHRDYVSGRTSHKWSMGSFRGAEPARVIVQGDGDTNLDCWIADENGQVIVSDERNTDACDLSWTPERTGTFALRITNNGAVYNVYSVTTN